MAESTGTGDYDIFFIIFNLVFIIFSFYFNSVVLCIFKLVCVFLSETRSSC